MTTETKFTCPVCGTEARKFGHKFEQCQPNPEVGMGVTLMYPQDRYGFVIIRVSPSGKTIWIAPLKGVDLSTGHQPARYDGPFPVWSHTYTDEERASMILEGAPERQVRLGKRGWASHGTPYSVGQAVMHRNYSY